MLEDLSILVAMMSPREPLLMFSMLPRLLTQKYLKKILFCIWFFMACNIVISQNLAPENLKIRD